MRGEWTMVQMDGWMDWMDGLDGWMDGQLGWREKRESGRLDPQDGLN